MHSPAFLYVNCYISRSHEQNVQVINDTTPDICEALSRLSTNRRSSISTLHLVTATHLSQPAYVDLQKTLPRLLPNAQTVSFYDDLSKQHRCIGVRTMSSVGRRHCCRQCRRTGACLSGTIMAVRVANVIACAYRQRECRRFQQSRMRGATQAHRHSEPCGHEARRCRRRSLHCANGGWA